MSDNKENQPAAAAQPTDFTSVLEQKPAEAGRPEISGTAIARMMGVATSVELKLLEGKLDLISNRMNNIGVRVDKIISQFQSLPTGSDMERIDVQIGSLKSLIRDIAIAVSGEPAKAEKKSSVKAQETEIVSPSEAESAAE